MLKQVKNSSSLLPWEISDYCHFYQVFCQVKHDQVLSFSLLFRDESAENEASVSNKFANDGSFLQQFLKLQKEKSNVGRLSPEQRESFLLSHYGRCYNAQYARLE